MSGSRSNVNIWVLFLVVWCQTSSAKDRLCTCLAGGGDLFMDLIKKSSEAETSDMLWVLFECRGTECNIDKDMTLTSVSSVVAEGGNLGGPIPANRSWLSGREMTSLR